MAKQPANAKRNKKPAKNAIRSNTAQNSERPPARGKPFAKNDPRINRNGRPRSFDALRELARRIACEIPESPDNVSKWSRVEIIMRAWALSKDPQLQRSFIEIAYGKVPIEANANIRGNLQHTHITFDVKYDDEPRDAGEQPLHDSPAPPAPAPV